MSGPNTLNLAWCRTIVARLVRAGVRQAVISVGGRNSAMALALEEQPSIGCATRIDERGAAFVALGLTRVSERPVVICTTSGTAVANLLPAATEAFATGERLILLTCDRPHPARAVDAPQTTDHLGLCAAMTGAQIDLPDPAADPDAFADLARSVDRILVNVAGAAPSPVQINVPLAGIISSIDVIPDEDRFDPVPLLAAAERVAWRPPSVPSGDGPATIDAFVSEFGLGPGRRGLIVAGPHPRVGADVVERLARATGYPVLADAASGFRRPALPNTVVSADMLVIHPAVALEAPPEIVILIGHPATATTVQSWLGRSGAPTLLISDRPRPLPTEWSRLLIRPHPGAIDRLGDRLGPGDRAWLERWINLDRVVAGRRRRLLGQGPWNDPIVVERACAAAGFARLFLASSLAVRLANFSLDAGPNQLAVDVNRGVNGIDGTIGSFLGTLAASGERGLLIIGDQAFLHDLPSLEPLTWPVSGAILVIDNGGAGLFDVSVWLDRPEIRPILRHPTRVNVGAVAQAFGLPYTRVEDASSLERALFEAATAPGLRLIHAVTPEDNLATVFVPMVRRLLTPDEASAWESSAAP